MTRAMLKIAAWEIRKGGTAARPAIIAFSLGLLLGVILISLVVSQTGLHMDNDIYTVVITDPGLKPIIESDQRFIVRVESPEYAGLSYRSGADVLVYGRNVYFHDSERSESAVSALDRVFQQYEEDVLVSKGDVENAFPVWIVTHYAPRQQVFQVPSAIGKDPQAQSDVLTTDETGVGEGLDTEIDIPTSPLEADDVEFEPEVQSIMEGGRGSLFYQEGDFTTPSHMAPPIPFRSVVVTFFFIFPMYFITQFYSTSIMQERLERQGIFLLTSPLSVLDVILGKMLPYLLITLSVAIGITLYLGGGLQAIVVLIPVALLFLTTSLVAAMLARSFKELTFFLIFLSVVLSGYLFFPAMFANVHAVSTISPMTLVVRALEGDNYTFAEYVFSTVPVFLVSMICLGFAASIFREESLFSQSGLWAKVIDGIEVFMRRIPWALFLLGVLSIPAAICAQLGLIVLLFNLPMQFTLPMFIITAALIEEILKSAGPYTAMSRGLSPTSVRDALRLGALSGLGFFAGEKLILFIVIAPIATSVFGSLMGIGLLLLPLALHVSGAAVSSLGLCYLGTSRGAYVASVVFAAIVHSAYNFTIVWRLLYG